MLGGMVALVGSTILLTGFWTMPELMLPEQNLMDGIAKVALSGAFGMLIGALAGMSLWSDAPEVTEDDDRTWLILNATTTDRASEAARILMRSGAQRVRRVAA